MKNKGGEERRRRDSCVIVIIRIKSALFVLICRNELIIGEMLFTFLTFQTESRN